MTNFEPIQTHPDFSEVIFKMAGFAADIDSKLCEPRKHLKEHDRCLQSLEASIIIPFLTSTSHRFSLNGWMGLIERLIEK